MIPFVDIAKVPFPVHADFRGVQDKMIQGRKSGKTGNTGGGDSDRKHLTSREVERLI